METKPYTWRTYQEIEVCQDCIYVSANGAPDYEGYADSGHSQRYAEGLKNWGDEPNTEETWGDEPNTDKDEPSFSRHACDFCGDKLGGYRFTASLMQLHTE